MIQPLFGAMNAVPGRSSRLKTYFIPFAYARPACRELESALTRVMK